MVAVLLKPYYNTVNLEKAGTSVKQKEFIQSIGGAQATTHIAHQRGGPPLGDFLLCVARMGSLGPRFTATYAEPLPPLYRVRCAFAATRDFPSPGTRPQSRRHRPRAQAPGSCPCSCEKFAPPRATIPPLAHPPRPFAGSSGSRHRCLRGFP